MISIANLTIKQKEMCESIWHMPDQASVVKWFDTLSPSDQVTAKAMLNLILAELIDQEPMDDLTAAQLVIDRVRWGHA